MFDEFARGAGLDVVIWLQSHGNPALDNIAQALHWMGYAGFFLAVMPLIYWSVDKWLGIKLVLALLLAAALNNAIKSVLQEPRPYQISRDVSLLLDHYGYGFPSGHTMVAVVVWGLLALEVKRWQALAIAAVYVLIMGWSRMYLGVHYPHDLIGGIVFGLILLYVLYHTLDWLLYQVRRLPVRAVIAAFILIGMWSIIFLYDIDEGAAAAGFVWGAGAGLLIERRRIRFSTAGPPGQRIVRYAIGVTLVGSMFWLMETYKAFLVLEVVAFIFIGYMALAGWPWMAIRLGLMQPVPLEPPPPVDLWTGV